MLAINKRLILVLLCCLSTITQAKMQGGGIQFMKPKPISIHRQDVTLSLDKISSNYVFINNSALEFIETMVFPAPYYPELNKKFEEQPFNQLDIIVDDRKIQYKTLQYPVSRQGENLTKLFQSLNISAEPTQVMSTIKQANENSIHIRNILNKHNLIDLTTNTLRWHMRTYYYWQQKFLPAEEIYLQQTHKPNIKIYRTNIQYTPQKDPKAKPWLNKLFKKKQKKAPYPINKVSQLQDFKRNLVKSFPYVQQFCPTNKDYSNLLQALKNSKQQTLIARELQYNLISNDTWSGAIDYFTLKVEQPKNMIICSCWPHKFTRPSATTLIFSGKNYMPAEDIAILFLQLK